MSFWELYRGENLVSDTLRHLHKVTPLGCHRDRIWVYVSLTPTCCCLLAKSCLTLCDTMNCMPGFPVFHCLLELTQTHAHWVSDAIQPSHPLSPPSTAWSYFSQLNYSCFNNIFNTNIHCYSFNFVTFFPLVILAQSIFSSIFTTLYFLGSC